MTHVRQSFEKKGNSEVVVGGNLRAAHRGYIYQDVVTAYILVEALVEQPDRVVVDRKAVENDRIDDLEVVVASRRVRRQVKWSSDKTRTLSTSDFTRSDSSLRIDELVLSHARAGENAADEYRLCATWLSPPAGTELAAYLVDVRANPTIPGTKTPTFRLNADAIWPAGGSPKWSRLSTEGSLQRIDFVRFCEKFVVELEMPPASLDLVNPGPLETALLDVLTRRVGIGIYPNDGIRPTDFAANAIFCATEARSRGAEYSAAEIAAKLQLRTDFGHVAQAFPLDQAVELPRAEARKQLLETALAGGLQVVTGPPGAGKSWQLTQLAGDLRNQGAVVARHYCYLDPSDDQAALRITSDVFFGNLIHELTFEAPELKSSACIGLAADFDALQRLLTAAGSYRSRVVLIIDGLDHIARVLADAPSLAPERSDIIDRLAALDIPDGVAVVIGSQPGEHLGPLQEQWGTRVSIRTLVPWSTDDLIALARAHGVAKSLGLLGVDASEIEKTLQQLAECADGNPLYARALSIDLLAGCDCGDIGNPVAWLSSTEAVAGGVLVYYSHLYEMVDREGHVIADLLGVLDFAVTQTDLEEMVGPLYAAYVARALRVLRPVLVEASAQGGLRVFHESFRRFIREKLAKKGQTVASVLSPVIAWLGEKGLFADARSFRFLLPALVRAGRNAEVRSHVGTAFVRNAVAAGYGRNPILANIALGADVARRNDDWALLVRCLELRRATVTTFDPSQNTWAPYIAGYLDVFGHGALAERLVFDGQPTLDRTLGLYACTLVDRAGGVAPWAAYGRATDESPGTAESSVDRGAFLTEEEAVEVHIVRKQLRSSSAVETLRNVYRFLCKHGAEMKPLMIRSLAHTTAEVLGVTNVATLAQDATARERCRLAPSVRCHLLLGIADAAREAKDEELARTVTTRAAAWVPDADAAVRCLEFGAPLPDPLPFTVATSGIPIGVGPDTWVHEAEPVRQWVAMVRLQARRSGGDDAVLRGERDRIKGTGWYRSWLRFTLDAAVVEALEPRDDADVVAAFRVLQQDAHPFIGTPRACDLWPVHHLIEESIERGLSMLRTREAWSEVLVVLARAAKGTQSTLQGEDSGAIPTGTFVNLLLPHVARTACGDLVLQAMEQRVAEHRATHYPTLAEFSIGLARARRATGDLEGARAAWADAAKYLTAYGWRKDPTFYELQESFDVLGAVEPGEALSVAAGVQDIADTVELHTDGKGTKYCVNQWLTSLLRLAPAASGLLVARANAALTEAIGWKTAESIRLVVDEYVGKADARLLEHLLLTIPTHEYTGTFEERQLKRRLTPLRTLAASDPSTACAAFRAAYAVLADDVRAKSDLRAVACEVMKSAGVCDLPVIRNVNDASSTIGAPIVTAADSSTPPPDEPVPNLGTTLADIYRALRAVARCETYNSSRQVIWGETVAALAGRLHELLADGRENDVMRILLFFARDAGLVTFSNDPHPLAMLAAALEERGHRSPAASAYVLAYTATRSGWGNGFGGNENRALIARATELDPQAARRIYADQLLATMRASSGWIELSADVLHRLSEWGDGAAVNAAWHEIFDVLNDRTPEPRLPGRLPRLDGNLLSTDWSLDEVVVALLLARVSDPRLHYKMAALRGFIHSVQHQPHAAARPLAWWLTLEHPRTSLVLVLMSLIESESAPYNVSHAIAPHLGKLADASSWLVHRRARVILERLGMPTSPRGPASNREPTSPSPSSNGDADLRFVWRAGSWRALRDVKSAFQDVVETAERMAHANLPHQRNRRERGELMWGMRYDAWPATPVVLWETEKLFEALDDALAPVMMRSVDDETYSGADPKTLEEAMVPDLQFHVGSAASRVARPNWEHPKDFVDRSVVDTLSIVSAEDDPVHTGWTRIALIERECPTPPDSYGARPDRDVTVWAAVVAWPRAKDVPDNAFPFLPCGEIPDTYGPIVGAKREGSWLGDPCRLEPPFSVVWECGLRRSKLGEPLVWYDTNGKVVVAVRTWRVLRDDPEGEPAALEGCDLIAHPDIVSEIEALHGELRELRVTSSKAVPTLQKSGE